MTNVLLNALKTATALMVTIATTVAGKGQNAKILVHVSKGALRILGAQPTTIALVTILFVTSLPTTTAFTVTHRQTAQRVRNVIPRNMFIKSIISWMGGGGVEHECSPKKGKGYLGNADSSTVFLLTRKTLFISRL